MTNQEFAVRCSRLAVHGSRFPGLHAIVLVLDGLVGVTRMGPL